LPARTTAVVRVIIAFSFAAAASARASDQENSFADQEYRKNERNDLYA
jgi:hypothetical protein